MDFLLSPTFWILFALAIPLQFLPDRAWQWSVVLLLVLLFVLMGHPLCMIASLALGYWVSVTAEARHDEA